ncbi:MAG: MFS transporter [Deltaproteobacteria bacterium]|nr:MFS transporter [Deltaproteobacteria bacterium]
MIFRFSLYGFLKNQLYFDAFLLIHMHHCGLSYVSIGFLLGFKSLLKNVLEIPSGLFSDIVGHRKTLIWGWISYIISFFLIGYGKSVTFFFIGFAFFALGEAFRTGTHKAIIFSYLTKTGQQEKRTKIYGYTRSWSQIGSAFASLVAGIVIIFFDNIQLLFFLAVVPYSLGIINFYFYPGDTIVNTNSNRGFASFFKMLYESIKIVLRKKELVGKITNSMFFDGTFHSLKPWFQILLLYAGLNFEKSYLAESSRISGIIIVSGYVILHSAGALGSRISYKFVYNNSATGKALNKLWGAVIILLVSMSIFAYLNFYMLAASHLIIFAFLYNIWRPIFLADFDKSTPENLQAMVLSIESQGKSIFQSITAPVAGIVSHYAGVKALPLFFCLIIICYLATRTVVFSFRSNQIHS